MAVIGAVRREHVRYITEAKKEETRAARIEKTVTVLLAKSKLL